MRRAVIVPHALQEAAQAGCRVYSVEATTQSDVSAIINTAMSQAGLSNQTVTFSPSSKAAIDVPMEPTTSSRMKNSPSAVDCPAKKRTLGSAVLGDSLAIQCLADLAAHWRQVRLCR